MVERLSMLMVYAMLLTIQSSREFDRVGDNLQNTKCSYVMGKFWFNMNILYEWV